MDMVISRRTGKTDSPFHVNSFCSKWFRENDYKFHTLYSFCLVPFSKIRSSLQVVSLVRAHICHVQVVRQELVEKERHAAAHKMCRPLQSSFANLLPGLDFGWVPAGPRRFTFYVFSLLTTTSQNFPFVSAVQEPNKHG